jgi:hypothetical protein
MGELGTDLILQQTINTSPNIDPSKRAAALDIATAYIQQAITRQDAASGLIQLTGNGGADLLNSFDAFVRQAASGPGGPQIHRRRPERWTPEEDARLSAAVETNGINNWQIIATLVGGGRTKAQCSQRWARCLDPRIDKSNWCSEEEAKLLTLVGLHGNKSWTKIAQEMGSRSDVQCRFRWNFLNQTALENGSEVKPISAPSILASQIADLTPEDAK